MFSNMNKGSNSVENGRILPINNPIPLIPDNTMYAKFEEIPGKLKLLIGNGEHRLTDRHPKVYHKTCHYRVAGYKKSFYLIFYVIYDTKAHHSTYYHQFWRLKRVL